MKIFELQLNEAFEISRWKYEGEYSFYNSEKSEEAINELMNGTYYSVRNDVNELIGYFCFGRSAQVPGGQKTGLYTGDNVLDIGLGMKPELTGKGMGMSFLTAGIIFADKTFNPHRLRLSVAIFNRRAVSLYTRAGFKAVSSFQNNGTPFVIMIR
ncbi:GNAT family N-acetyltransferase [Paenibacillus alkalitolerans]|uniref:GNAT family N-acetyltransferase n=1 Tax=Paenibacillus alkalitolerans TaxID=2799335 RepID=UPI0018F3CBCB|nr:GNAT family protein [Paenibacillus alkalitolerans]